MKKRLLIALLVVFAVSVFVSGATGLIGATAKDDGTFTEESRDIDTGYLLRENFSPYDSAGSGWIEKNMPAGAGIQNVYSTNTTLETFIKKAFVRQSGEIEVEIASSICMNISVGYFSVLGESKGKEVNAVRFNVENNMIKYVDKNGVKTNLCEFSYDYSVGIKIRANAATNEATVYVNGAKTSATTGLSFNESCDKLTGIKFCIPKNGTGGFSLEYVTVRKGYDVFEDFSTVGVVEQHEPGYDYNSGSITTNVTVNDHSIQNDNNELARLCYDNDDNTFWKHNTQYSITQNVYFMMQYGKAVSVDYLYVKFHKYYQGAITVTYKSPSGSWSSFGSIAYQNYETTEDNGYVLEVKSPAPVTLLELAIGFQVGTKPYNIASGQIEVSSIVVRCDHPNEIDIDTYPSDFIDQIPENVDFHTALHSGDRLLEVNDENPTESGSTAIELSRQGDVTVDFKAMFEDNADGNRFALFNSDGNYIGIETKDNCIQFVSCFGGNVSYTKIENAENHLRSIPVGIWTNLIFKFNNLTQTVAIDYNGWSPIDDVALEKGFANSLWTKFEIRSAQGKTHFYFDNLKIFKTLEESLVPEINVCETGDTILTMQVCSLWREGTHTNWQVVDYKNGYERKPILGWYDEGTAEVADWEIKIAREHGISNFMYCWYRKGTDVVKESNYSDAIWDGLFKSKFRNDINFTIMFENGSSSMYSYDDLIENLMPYWIEVFFKNPNYQKTADGKPILYIYQGDMLNIVGDVNGDGKKDKLDMQIVTAKMREMCVEAGFPGLYLAAECRQSSSSVIKAIEEYGYDSVFAYCWTSGQQNVSDDSTLAYTESMMLNQLAAVQNEDLFKILPNISRCWDPSAWMDCGFNPQGATYAYDLEHYRELCLWVKDVFGGQKIDDAGTKMIMLDNWNEYAEGHWLMPSYGIPSYKDGSDYYGFLDVLREVFAINNYEHVDHIPLEEGYGPYDTWYPKGWNDRGDEYSEIFGKPSDNSVADSDNVDWNIGYNTLGGSTAYISSFSDGIIEAKDSVRVYLSKEVVQEAKRANKGLTIKMLNGSVGISMTEIGKLSGDKSLEIVLNRLNDVTEYAIALRKSEKYMPDGFGVDFSLKQSGSNVDITASIEMANAPDYSEIVSIVNGNITAINLSAVKSGPVIYLR